MPKRKQSGQQARVSGPVVGMGLAVFTALSLGVAQSQVAVDAVPWVESVFEEVRALVVSPPVAPAAPTPGRPIAVSPVFRDDNLNRPPDDPDPVPANLPDPVAPVPMTPYGPLPRRVVQRGSRDAAQMCAGICKDDIREELQACVQLAPPTEQARTDRAPPDPSCHRELFASYRSCLIECGFTNLPASPGTVVPQGSLGGALQGATP